MLPTDGDDDSNPSHTGQSSSLHTSLSWPRLPELLLTNSHDTPTQPVLYSSPLANNVYRRSSNASKNNDTDSSSEYVSDDDAASRQKTDRNDLNEKTGSTHEKADSQVDGGSADTLVEAALDQDEAKDRHVRFPDHVAESAALVQRMLSTRGYSDGTSSAKSSHRRADSSIDMQSENSGSVLASLMKLEAQRRQQPSTSSYRSKRKKSKKKKRPKEKPASLYNFPLTGSADALKTTVIPRQQRPKMVNRPASWLSTMTTTNHLVPSLEKRKKDVAASSRRSSVDSMMTTASQFEPITLEDRIRITFEIANILQKQEFLRKLAKSLMLYGTPAHRLEYIMREVSRTLGVDAEYVYMPNVMFVTFFDQSTHTTETHFIRQAQLFDMHKLGEIYRLEKLISHGEVSVDEALEFIDNVANEDDFYPLWWNPIIYAIASFCGCIMFFGGRWKEGGMSAILAMFFAVYELFSGRFISFQPIWEITVCILIGFVARAIWRYDFCFTPIAFSAFIVILPGYSMAIAIIELVSRQLVSGVIRMVYAILYSFLLGYGVGMGSALFGTIDPASISEQALAPACKKALNAGTCFASVSQWYYFLTVPLFAVAYCIYLRARPPRWPVMIIVSAAGYVTNYALSCHAKAPPQVLQVVPAFVIGMLGNLLTKFTGKMSFDAVLLAVFYLVPGSLGLKAALGLFGSGGGGEFANQGSTFALSMIEVSIGITVGLFVANLIVYPKGTAHTPLMNF